MIAVLEFTFNSYFVSRGDSLALSLFSNMHIILAVKGKEW